MNWHRHIGSLAAIAVAAVALPALAQTLVIKSAGPSARSYPPGRKLAANAKVALRAGDTLTLLDNRGTRTLRGPGVFNTSVTAVADNKANAGLVALLGARRISHARTGAVRGVIEDDTPAHSSNLWYVDITKPQTACEPDPAKVRLWRPDIDTDAVYTIRSHKTGHSAEVKFARGEAVEIWPADKLPVSDGAAFTLTGPGLAQPVDVTFAEVPPQQPQAEQVATTLLTHGCQAQLDLLVATVPDLDAPAGSGA